MGGDDSLCVVWVVCVDPSHGCHIAGSSSKSASQHCVNTTLHGAHVATDSDKEQ